MNCTTVTRKHPLFPQSLESWYGWVGGCCITTESRTGHVTAVKAMELFEALYVERWLQGKGPSKVNATVIDGEGPLDGQVSFNGKGKGVLKSKALR